MIARRTLAILLLPVLCVAFLVALVSGRVDATVLNPDFLHDHAEEADLFALAHDEGIAAFVDQFVARQHEKLPEHLRAANLPTDAEARVRMAEVVQTLLPPELIRELTDALVAGVFPYMIGRSDSFEATISLHDPLVAAFGHEPGEQSQFEAMWLDLDLSERLIVGFTTAAIEDDGADGGLDGETPIEEAGLRAILAQDTEGAADWWDEQFFGFINGLLPFLVGDSDELDLRIDFTEYPLLAHAFAGPLRSDVRTLQREGWRFTDDDLHARLAETEGVSMADIEGRLAIFRADGLTFDEQDLIRWSKEQRQAALDDPERADDDAPPDFAEQRERIRALRIGATWGSALASVFVVGAVAFLGGRGWNGRLRWGSASLIFASTVALVVTVPVWALTASPRLEERVREFPADTESSIPEPVRERLATAGLDALHAFASGMQWRAAAWFVLAALVLGVSIAWEREGFHARVRESLGRGDTTPISSASAGEPPAGSPAP